MLRLPNLIKMKIYLFKSDFKLFLYFLISTRLISLVFHSVDGVNKDTISFPKKVEFAWKNWYLIRYGEKRFWNQSQIKEEKKITNTRLHRTELITPDCSCAPRDSFCNFKCCYSKLGCPRPQHPFDISGTETWLPNYFPDLPEAVSTKSASSSRTQKFTSLSKKQRILELNRKKSWICRESSSSYYLNGISPFFPLLCVYYDNCEILGSYHSVDAKPPNPHIYRVTVDEKKEINWSCFRTFKNATNNCQMTSFSSSSRNNVYENLSKILPNQILNRDMKLLDDFDQALSQIINPNQTIDQSTNETSRNMLQLKGPSRCFKSSKFYNESRSGYLPCLFIIKMYDQGSCEELRTGMEKKLERLIRFHFMGEEESLELLVFKRKRIWKRWESGDNEKNPGKDLYPQGCFNLTASVQVTFAKMQNNQFGMKISWRDILSSAKQENTGLLEYEICTFFIVSFMTLFFTGLALFTSSSLLHSI